MRSPKTDKGIQVGSTEAAAKTAYPAGVQMSLTDDKYGDGKIFPYLSVPNGSGRYMLFYFGESGGQVTRISVQAFPNDVYEYCG